MSRRGSKARALAILLMATIAVVALPYVGALWRYGGKLPPGYGEFPPVSPPAPVPGFDLGYFLAFAAVAAAIAAVILVPSLFGFEAVPAPLARPRGPFPFWFWWGGALTVLFWGLMWFGSPPLARFTFVPLWFSFTFFLDGWVYARLGRSIVSRRHNELLILAVVSIVGWYMFEYLNFFVLEDWIYPYTAQLLTPFGVVVWVSLSFATVWPAVFEWYMLLASFPALLVRWSRGPAWLITRPTAAVIGGIGIALSVAVSFQPYLLFWAIWAAPALLLLAGLKLAGFWTPFDPGGRGDWSRILMMALGTFLNGLVWEFWNYGSDQFHRVAGQVVHTNPNFWVYRIPYVDVVHVFSEMPLLGYFGYFGFGVICWLFWLALAHVAGLDPDFATGDVHEGLGFEPQRQEGTGLEVPMPS